MPVKVSVKAVGDGSAGGGRRLSRRAALWILPLLPLAAASATLALPPDRPLLFGVPLFYVLHFAVCVLSAAVTALLRRLYRAADEPLDPAPPKGGSPREG